MTIVYQTGDLFTSQMPAFAHGVNIHGVMGSGIAVAVKTLYPDVYQQYRDVCDSGRLSAGGMFPAFSVRKQPSGVWVLNMASQDKPGANAKLSWLAESLTKALSFCDDQGITGLAIPRIGAGIGGLTWEDAHDTIQKVANSYPDITLEIWSLPDAK